MGQILVFIFTVFLAGCTSTQPRTVPGTDGRAAYVVECLGKEKNCYPQAKNLCPEGYRVIDSKYRAVMNWQGFEVENTLKYTLVIECHNE